ncbi:MAG TPA: DUF1707 and DUF4190 domain-containing protein [Pseudonocardiaceae bacterium]|nr:DUF1707 and DUF4190 domain-containing protein [Pseudonocardiaceae bacterium]
MTDPGRQVRISDSDRQAAADRLRAAQSEGRLPVAEYDDRLGKLYQAVTYGDMETLFRDLPGQMAQQQPMMQMQMPMQQPMMQPMQGTGAIGGPAAIVQNSIVVAPTVLPSSGFATAGMVFGILALCGFWIPFGDFGLAGLAIILSIVGLVQTSGNRLGGHGQAVGGLVMGIVALLPTILFFTLVFAAASAVVP